MSIELKNLNMIGSLLTENFPIGKDEAIGDDNRPPPAVRQTLSYNWHYCLASIANVALIEALSVLMSFTLS